MNAVHISGSVFFGFALKTQTPEFVIQSADDVSIQSGVTQPCPDRAHWLYRPLTVSTNDDMALVNSQNSANPPLLSLIAA